MTEPAIQTGSVGVVDVQSARIELPPEGLRLESGGILPELTVLYETYGDLSPARDNVIYICHALTGDAHAAGYHEEEGHTPGWWEDMIGPGKGIDTRYYHVVCGNILGGCQGTTGPSSINPATGKPYGSSFPQVTVGDIVDVHVRLLKHLGIDRLAAVIGGSFGGMQALEWGVRYPDRVDHCICIASARCLSAQALAFDIIGRRAITSDPDWQGGDYYGTGRTPVNGLTLARKIGHITYLSPQMMNEKFGRERRDIGAPAPEAPLSAIHPFTSDFQVESYLEYQGEKFVQRFDANSYLSVTRAMDEYDLLAGHANLEEALARTQAKMLIVAISSDWLFPPEQSMEIANALVHGGKHVSYCRLFAPHGHDAFLIDVVRLTEVLRAFLPWVSANGTNRRSQAPDTTATSASRPGASRLQHTESSEEFGRLLGMIQPGARILDLGCGDGALLSLLEAQRQVTGLGMEIDIDRIIDVLDRGHDVYQADIDDGLSMLPDQAYDYAILSETLQVVRRPRDVLREMLRVAREGIVTFPNFAKWHFRAQLGLRGRMPRGKALPFEWYDTPNIHLFTLKDFFELCRSEGYRVLDTACLSDGPVGRTLISLGLCNMGADHVLIRVGRDDRSPKTRRRIAPPCT